MPHETSRNTSWSIPVPLTALEIGQWEVDENFTRIHGDPVFASMYGLSAEAAARGITFAELQSIIHPDDVDHDYERRRRMRKTGGLFVWEHRIVPRAGLLRWVLVRAQFEPDEHSRMRGRGITVDITCTRSDVRASGSTRFLEVQETPSTPLQAFAARSLKIHEHLSDLSADVANRVRPAAEALLYEVAYALAETLPEGLQQENGEPTSDPRRMH